MSANTPDLPPIPLDQTNAGASTYGLLDSGTAEVVAITAVGDYKLEAKLGAGAMGAVYRAVRQSTGRVVALKVLSAAVARREGFVQRFHREARAMGKLTHPNIVRYLAAGESDGQVYLAMELVEGGSVTDRVKKTGRMSVAAAMAVGVAAGRALGYAHENQFVHRDVKPDNLLITQ